MKPIVHLLTTCLFASVCASAAPLRKADVAADAKWVLHLDAEQLRSTSTGNYLITDVAEKLFARQKADIKQHTGLDLDLTKFNSVTAYGDYTNHVVLIRADIDAEKMLDSFLDKMKRDADQDPPPVVKTTEDGLVTYTIEGHASVTIRPDKTIVGAPTRAAIRRANQVLDGKSPNLSSTKSFTAFPESPKAFFFLAAAEGFNATELTSAAEANDGDNPKAKILKMADGGRLVLGQEADQLFADISLKAKSPAVVKQMQQVIQGMIALAALAQTENTNIEQLADSAKVTTAGDVVTLSLNLPAEAAMDFLKTNVVENAGQKHHKSARHHETNAPPEHEE